MAGVQGVPYSVATSAGADGGGATIATSAVAARDSTEEGPDAGAQPTAARCLPLDVLAAIASLDVRGLAAHVRPVCRDWRLTFDSVVARLACAAPDEPPGRGSRCSKGSSSGSSSGDNGTPGIDNGSPVSGTSANNSRSAPCGSEPGGLDVGVGSEGSGGICNGAGDGSTGGGMDKTCLIGAASSSATIPTTTTTSSSSSSSASEIGSGPASGEPLATGTASSCAGNVCGGSSMRPATLSGASAVSEGGAESRRVVRQLLPLAFERLVSCELECVPSNAALRRVVAALAGGSPLLTGLRVGDSGGVTELPPEVARLAGLVRLAVNWTAVGVLPAGLGGLSRLEVLDLSFNSLQQLPQSLASLPRLRALLCDHNLLTDLPQLPGSLSRVDVSYNRLRHLSCELQQLPMLTSLAAVHAFSHPPSGEGGPVVAVLARLAAARGGGAVALRVDGGIAEAVRTRARLLLGDVGAPLRVIGDG